jgi:hypothetical protein
MLRESSRATYANITERRPSSTGTPQQYDARQHEDYPSAGFSHTGDVRQPPTGTPNISNVMPSTPASTSFGARHRQSSMTALSPGPSRIVGASSPYPDDDPPAPIHGLRGYGAPRRAEFTGASLHLKSDSALICWQLSHDKGPYGGNHAMKFKYRLPSDATTELMLLFNFLRKQFQATGFQHALLPDIDNTHSLVDHTRSPIEPNYMSNRDRPEWSTRAYWRNAHRELGFSLHHILALVSSDSTVAAPVFACVVSEHSYSGDGFAVLNELLRLHFPHGDGTRAPSFDTAAQKKIIQNSSETIPEYERRFTLWLRSLRLYREFGRCQDPEVTMWFIDGLLSRHQLFLEHEYVDLKQFHSLHRLAEDKPRLPIRIQHYSLCERLRLALGDASRRQPPRSTPIGAQVAWLDGDGHSPVATVHPPDPNGIADANVAALHHPRHDGSNQRGPPRSQGFAALEKAVPCGFSPCAGRSHPPNVCCVCDSPHRVSRCWHLLGLPPDRQTRLNAFKQLKDAGDAPFKAQIAAIDAEIAALEALDPVSPEPFNSDVADITTDMRTIEAQFHPGYDFPPHSSAIDYFETLSSPPKGDALTISIARLDLASAFTISGVAPRPTVSTFEFDFDEDLNDLPDLWYPATTDCDASSTDSLPELLARYPNTEDCDDSSAGSLPELQATTMDYIAPLAYHHPLRVMYTSLRQVQQVPIPPDVAEIDGHDVAEIDDHDDRRDYQLINSH